MSKRQLKRRKVRQGRLIALAAVIVLLLAAIVFIIARCSAGGEGIFPRRSPGATPGLETTPVPTPTPTPRPSIEARQDKLGVETKLNLDGRDIGGYERSEPIFFGRGDEYTQLEGVITFRGNTFRDATSFGSPTVTEKKLIPDWKAETGAVPKSGSGIWSGAGWTGQPIIVRWPDNLRRIMNINDEKKNKAGLIEVIYAEEDGKVRFLDLEDGQPTRDPINVGMAFKGSGGIDPRGYPLLYVGAGDGARASNGGAAKKVRFFIFSLIDGKMLYEFGADPDPFSEREWHAYDGAATVHAETDTLIECGENGIIYTIKLNTKFDPAAGTISIEPSEMLKMRYSSKKHRDGMAGKTYWLGMEDSPVFWGQYMFVADNGGTLLCVDLNAMKVVWTQDVLDDTNCSPVLEVVSATEAYIYISTSLHWTARNGKGTIPIWKINAFTGEKMWEKPYECHTVTDLSGGVQSTALLGKGQLKDLVYFSIARTPEPSKGLLVALDKRTSEEKWRYPLGNYTWSSPVAVYAADGNGYVIICDNDGKMHLLDGLTGDVLDSIQLAEGVIEATPAVFGDTIIVGSRDQKIYCVRIK